MSRSFNADTDDITVASNANIDGIFDTGGTILVWIYPNSDGENSVGRIVDKASGETTAYVIFLLAEAAGKCKLRFYALRDDTNGLWNIGLDITIGAWNHLAFVYDASSVDNDPVIYANGLSVNVIEEITPVGIYTDSGEDMLIGADTQSLRTFDGLIAGVVGLKAELTADEIMAVAKGVIPHRVRPAAFNFPLWGVHSPEIDLSGNGSSGVVTGAVWANHPPVTLFTPRAVGIPLIETGAPAYDPSELGFEIENYNIRNRKGPQKVLAF